MTPQETARACIKYFTSEDGSTRYTLDEQATVAAIVEALERASQRTITTAIIDKFPPLDSNWSTDMHRTWWQAFNRLIDNAMATGEPQRALLDRATDAMDAMGHPPKDGGYPPQFTPMNAERAGGA